jgi:hypothetical protein
MENQSHSPSFEDPNKRYVLTLQLLLYADMDALTDGTDAIRRN